MSRWRRLLVPTLALIPVLVFLAGLGTWQVQRLQWKTSLLATIAAAEAGPPVPLADRPTDYSKVFAEGRFLHAEALFYGVEVRNGVLGTHLVTPLDRGDSSPLLLVDRGWVPMDGGTVTQPEGPVRVEGYVRPSETAGLFSATDDPVRRRFYSFDPMAMGAAIGRSGLAPFGLVALGPQGPGLPQPAATLPRPTNTHLGYAITWYGLALAALGVFVAWARTRLKEPA
jgi:surfeit locus 1 family protein